MCAVAVLTPILMNALEKRGFLSRYPWSVAPIQLALLGFCLTFATPMCCALFSQRASISVSSLESELQVSHSEFKVTYEAVPKSFRTGILERELQMVELSATRCSCMAILI